jgi:hypothetical protein
MMIQDTKDPLLREGGQTNFREYLDNSHEWQDYLRALFYAYHKRSESGTSPKLPNFKQLGNEFQLRLRDGFRNENRIVFFKLAVNRRRVSMSRSLHGVGYQLDMYSVFTVVKVREKICTDMK